MHWIGALISIELFRSGLRAATPLIGAAVGEVVVERTGSVNVGLEGILLVGAFSGVVGSWFLHSVWGGLVVAGLVGAITGGFLAFVCVCLGANQVVAGMALNLLAAGLTTFLNRAIFGSAPPAVPAFESWPVPGLGQIPGIGPIVFNHIALVYLVVLVAIATGIFLGCTQWGLRLRAVGEHSRAAESVGIPVSVYQTGALIFCGFISGIAGTYFSLGNVRFFTDNMTVGNGFIALAVVIVARRNAFLVIPVALFFGLASAFALRAQVFRLPIPYEILLILPYALTLVVYAASTGKAHSPAVLGRQEDGYG